MTELPKFERVKTHKKKDLNLFVGLYYTLSVKSIPNCFVTYETEPREDTNLMQIAFHDTEDYEPGGIQRNNTLWTILPAENGENDYFLKVLSLPEGILTYSHGLSWGGRYLELDLTHPEYYKPGSTMHASSLWHFEPTELSDYFTIHNSDERRSQNFVTFSNEPSVNGQLMQIGTKDLHLYQPKGTFRNDALWNFRPANFILTARICNFEYDMPTAEDFKNCSIPIQVTDEILVVNDTSDSHFDINEDVKLAESFVICFLQSFKMFQEERIMIECDMLQKIPGIVAEALSYTDLPKFSKLTNTQWCSNEERSFSIKQRLLLKPTESAKVTGFCNWVYNVEIPFTATVEFRATCDIAYCPTPVELHCVNTEIRECEIIEYLVKYEKFTGKVVPRNKNSPNGVVHCTVNGRIKTSFGLDTKVQVKYL